MGILHTSLFGPWVLTTYSTVQAENTRLFDEPGEDGDIEQVIHKDGIDVAKEVAQHMLRAGLVDSHHVGRVVQEVADPAALLWVTEGSLPEEAGQEVLAYRHAGHCKKIEIDSTQDTAQKKNIPGVRSRRSEVIN